MTQITKTLLIDADQIMFRKCDTLDDIDFLIEDFIERIINTLIFNNKITEETKIEVAMFLTSKKNKRKEIYTEYKANRKDFKLPEFYNDIKQTLIDDYNANILEGYEADDLIGYFRNLNDDYIVCTQDKDILYTTKNYAVNTNVYKLGLVTNTDNKIKYFNCKQLIMGDATDNIPRLEMNDFIRQMFGLGNNRVFSEATVDSILSKFKPENYYKLVDLLFTLSNSIDLEVQKKLINVDADLSHLITDFETIPYEVDPSNFSNNVYKRCEYELWFGKYKGKLICEVNDINWLNWAYGANANFKEVVDNFR